MDFWGVFELIEGEGFWDVFELNEREGFWGIFEFWIGLWEGLYADVVGWVADGLLFEVVDGLYVDVVVGCLEVEFWDVWEGWYVVWGEDGEVDVLKPEGEWDRDEFFVTPEDV